MKKPVVIIINGLPASGKTTLAKRLGADLALPVLSRDGIYENLYTTLGSETGGEDVATAKLGSASFKLLYEFAGVLLAASRSLIIEQFFGRPDLRTAEFLELQRVHAFEPAQVLCRAAGSVLLERYLARMASSEKQNGLQDAAVLAQFRERLLQGELLPLDLSGPIIEVDTTSPAVLDYSGLNKLLANYLQK